jgi:hypothetical protein
MKTITIAVLAAIMTGCATAPNMDVLESHKMKVDFNRHFCEGKGFIYYNEGRTSFNFRCSDGGYFSLSK